jgi:hypothetical protein
MNNCEQALSHYLKNISEDITFEKIEVLYTEYNNFTENIYMCSRDYKYLIIPEVEYDNFSKSYIDKLEETFEFDLKHSLEYTDCSHILKFLSFNYNDLVSDFTINPKKYLDFIEMNEFHDKELGEFIILKF